MTPLGVKKEMKWHLLIYKHCWDVSKKKKKEECISYTILCIEEREREKTIVFFSPVYTNVTQEHRKYIDKRERKKERNLYETERERARPKMLLCEFHIA